MTFPQQLCASGVVATVTEADLQHPDSADAIKRYFHAARAEAHDCLPLFRLAWDATRSTFCARQIQDERFFFGTPYEGMARNVPAKSLYCGTASQAVMLTERNTALTAACRRRNALSALRVDSNMSS